VHVDRIASAWLIRRFIDAEARFKFVAARGYKPKRGELRFDMFEAEYTPLARTARFRRSFANSVYATLHCALSARQSTTLTAKDEQFNRPETAGISGLISGIVQAHSDDHAR